MRDKNIIGERIMVLGPSASGKSTLAHQLGQITGINVIHLDRLFWNPGWVETPSEEMDQKVINAASEDRWIIDGNYFRTLQFRMERASSVVYIDFNRYFCIFRAIKRWIGNYGKTRWDLGDDCLEKIDLEFLSWIWNYPKRSRSKVLEMISLFGNNSNNGVYILKSRKDVRAFKEITARHYSKQANYNNIHDTL